MKTLLTFAAAAFLSATSANATVIDFSSATSGTSIVQSGVTITAAGQTISVTSSPNGTAGLLAEGSPRAEFLATFDVLTSSVSVDLGDVGADADLLFLEAFGVGDTLLGADSLLIDGLDSVMHTLSVSASGISYVRFGSRAPSINGSSVYADNLTFTSGAVPEPATWAMMLLGFGGIGFQMRSKRGSASIRQIA
jgi:hypothetical protein